MNKNLKIYSYSQVKWKYNEGKNITDRMIGLEIINILEINKEDFKSIKSHIFKEHIASVLNIKYKGKIDQEISIQNNIEAL